MKLVGGMNIGDFKGEYGCIKNPFYHIQQQLRSYSLESISMHMLKLLNPQEQSKKLRERPEKPMKLFTQKKVEKSTVKI